MNPKYSIYLVLLLVSTNTYTGWTDWVQNQSVTLCDNMINSPLTSQFNKDNWRAIKNAITKDSSQDSQTRSVTPTHFAGTLPVDIEELIHSLCYPIQGDFPVQVPQVILLYGPPGTGKTTIAREIASRAHASFITVSAPELIDMWVGSSARHVRDLYARANQQTNNGTQYAIIFIDEIDAIGGARHGIISDGAHEYQNALNELLNQIDGFVQNDHVITIFATNLPDMLDAALKRRIKLALEVPLPDETMRKDVMQFYLHDYPCDSALNLDAIVQETECFSNADLKLLIERTAVHTRRAKAKQITQEYITKALEEVHKKRYV